jgi:hypothetical protein
MGAFLGCDCGSELELGVSTLLIIYMVVAAGMLQHHRTIIYFILFQHHPIFCGGCNNHIYYK